MDGGVNNNDAHWINPVNWQGWIYFCKQDTRLLVPKRVAWMGWTLNFGHPHAQYWVIAMTVLPSLLVVGVTLGVSDRKRGC